MPEDAVLTMTRALCYASVLLSSLEWLVLRPQLTHAGLMSWEVHRTARRTLTQGLFAPLLASTLVCSRFVFLTGSRIALSSIALVLALLGLNTTFLDLLLLI